uniref:Secreted protein n=1 Tax=Lutzomyia longipalpis TaxID=7200 RepID=A0A1B0GLI4_LUTLO
MLSWFLNKLCLAMTSSIPARWSSGISLSQIDTARNEKLYCETCPFFEFERLADQNRTFTNLYGRHD